LQRWRINQSCRFLERVIDSSSNLSKTIVKYCCYSSNMTSKKDTSTVSAMYTTRRYCLSASSLVRRCQHTQIGGPIGAYLSRSMRCRHQRDRNLGLCFVRRMEKVIWSRMTEMNRDFQIAPPRRILSPFASRTS
jgi:hypothetical protein